MTASGDRSIWALLEEAAQTLPEPFSASRLIDYVSQRRHDVAEASIRTHINYALAGSKRTGPWASRTPFLERVERGVYRRLRGAASGATAVVPAPTTLPAPPVPLPPSSTGRVVLVGCSKQKASAIAPARQLFRGPSFRRARDYAARSGDSWYVLSAKFGLLHPDEPIAPYDDYLGDRSSSYRAAWGEWVVAQLDEQQALAGSTVEVHASAVYCAPLRGPLQRAGAQLVEPLSGLGQGERLAWPGYAGHPSAAQVDTSALLDPASAVRPEQLLAEGSAGLDGPGLYTWWIDQAGAADLSRGMGHPVSAGLLYAGKAGGHRREAAPSSATLWGRVVGNHLRGNVRSSTFRQSLAAILREAGVGDDEDAVTRWMFAHLRVAMLPVPPEDVGRLEDELVAAAQPPLNLSGLPRDERRSELTRLRGLLRGTTPSEPNASARAEETAVSQDEVVAAFTRRLMSDLDRILRTGYRPTIYQRMLAEHGAVGTAKRLLAAPRISDGFRHLWEHGELRLTVEHAVVDAAFEPLFTDHERDVAAQRLRDAGWGG